MKPPVKTAPAASVANSGSVPIIYADGVSAFGQANGIVALEFAATVLMPMNDGVTKSKNVATFHLRMPVNGANGLMEALEKVLTTAPPIVKQ
jgi:hypothetical protein